MLDLDKIKTVSDEIWKNCRGRKFSVGTSFLATRFGISAKAWVRPQPLTSRLVLLQRAGADEETRIAFAAAFESRKLM